MRTFFLVATGVVLVAGASWAGDAGMAGLVILR